jgi:hypothetical protein
MECASGDLLYYIDSPSLMEAKPSCGARSGSGRAVALFISAILTVSAEVAVLNVTSMKPFRSSLKPVFLLGKSRDSVL